MIVEATLKALGTILVPQIVLAILVGVLVGVIIGATPGIGPPIGLALLLPVTIPLGRWTAIIAMLSLYVGGLYGGAVSAILINVPGTPAAIASTFDGYPLSKQGRADYALNVSVLASSIGVMLAALSITVAIPVLISLLLRFGTPEYALVGIFGLTIIPVVSRGSMAKSLLMASFGLLLSTVGMAPMSPVPRFALGRLDLMNGLSFISILLGVFAVSEMIKLVGYEGSISGSVDETDADTGGFQIRSYFQYISDILLVNTKTFVKATYLGLVIGLIPAAGGAVSNIIAYAEEKRSSDDPESFGTGNERGLIASEAANSGTIPGSLVPVLSFGIPGSPTSAIILGGLVLHGIRPGPQLFAEQASISYTVFLSMLVGGAVLLVVGLVTVPSMSKITRMNLTLIIPVVTVMSFVGAYALNVSYLDVFTVVATGLFGYLMMKYNYSLVALVMGVILGPIIEENVHRGLQIGGLGAFVSSPTSILLVVLVVLSLGVPAVNYLRSRFQ